MYARPESFVFSTFCFSQVKMSGLMLRNCLTCSSKEESSTIL